MSHRTAPILLALLFLAPLFACSAPRLPADQAAEVVRGVHQCLQGTCMDRAAEKTMDLDEAMDWAEDDAWDEIEQEVARIHGVLPQQVDDAWSERGSNSETISSSYGGGTFTLGQRAMEGYGEDALRRWPAVVPPSPEDWWKNASRAERASFLLALLAEESGKLATVELRARDCSTCYGLGFLEYFSLGAEDMSELVPCPRCKTLSFDRLVVVR